jgi:hypothetical protein
MYGEKQTAFNFKPIKTYQTGLWSSNMPSLRYFGEGIVILVCVYGAW